MQKRVMLSLAVGVLCLAGCTARNWYDGFQMQQRRECEKLTQQHEMQRCLERVNEMTYDRYSRERDAKTQK